MNQDLHDNAIGYFTDMFVMSCDDEVNDRMYITDKTYRDYLRMDLTDDVIDSLMMWGIDVFREVTRGDYEDDIENKDNDLIRWMIVSWPAEMQERGLDVSSFFRKVIGAKIDDDTIEHICFISKGFHIPYEKMN